MIRNDLVAAADLVVLDDLFLSKRLPEGGAELLRKHTEPGAFNPTLNCLPDGVPHGDLLPEPFTFLDLQKIHEVILGGTVEKKSLMRRYLGAELLEEAAETRQEGRMRPAQLYRLKDRKTIHYFVRTMEGPRAGEE